MTDISALEAYAGQMSEAAARSSAAANKQHQYIHGNDQADVSTESGPVPCIAKQARISQEATSGLAGKLASAAGTKEIGLHGLTLEAALISPKMAPYLAQGDGVTNDEVAVTAFDNAYKCRVVDLLGATFVVSTIPTRNAYINGFFKVNGFKRSASWNDTFAAKPPSFHAFGGQLSRLKASLTNPLEQFTGIVFIGDSITWGSGNTGEQAPTDPRDGTLSDPRDYFGTSSYVNIIKKLKLVCVTGLLPLMFGCQSLSTLDPLPPRIVTVGCEKPPAPEAWFMQPYEPNLTQRMLSELSPSPMKAIED